MTDVGCWEQPSESAHAQMELIELLASLGARPTVLALLLACDDLAMRPWASRATRADEPAQQSETLRVRLATVAGASTHWLRIREPSSAPPFLQLSLAAARHVACAGVCEYERVLIPDTAGLPLLPLMAPVMGGRARVSVLALNPLLWRRQWCLRPMRHLDELDEADREAQSLGALADGPGTRAAEPDELILFSAELGEWLGRRALLAGRVLFAPTPPVDLARLRGADVGAPAHGSPVSDAMPASTVVVAAFADWADAQELALLGRTLRHAAAELAAAAAVGGAQRPLLRLVARRSAVDCAGRADVPVAAAAAARAKEALLRWARSATGWPGPWHEIGAAGQQYACSPLAGTRRVTALFAVALGGVRPPPELMRCAEAGARVIASDLPAMRAALTRESWAHALVPPRERTLGDALVAAIRDGMRAAPDGGRRASVSMDSSERAGWWRAWARTHASSDTLSARNDSAALNARTQLSPCSIALLLAACAPKAPAHLSSARGVRLLDAALSRAIELAARAGGDGSAHEAAWTVLCAGGSAAQWGGALRAANVLRASIRGFGSDGGAPDGAGPHGAGASWVRLAVDDAAAAGSGGDARACASLESVARALNASASAWLLVLPDLAYAPATPLALAQLAERARAAPEHVCAIAPIVRECDVRSDAAGGDAPAAEGGSEEGGDARAPPRCALCIPSGAAANAGALADVLTCGAVLMRTSALRDALRLLGPAAPVRASDWAWHLLSVAVLNGGLVDVPAEVLLERECPRRDGATGESVARSSCARASHALPFAAYGALARREGWLGSAAQLAQERHLAAERCASDAHALL